MAKDDRASKLFGTIERAFIPHSALQVYYKGIFKEEGRL